MAKRANRDRGTSQTGNGQEGRTGSSRRRFLKGLGLVAGAAGAQAVSGGVSAQQRGGGAAATLDRLRNANGRAVMLKDGIVLSMDRQVGDFEKADVVIQGNKILAVGPNAAAPAQATVVNAPGMIVMPGMIDPHHHQYQTILRSILADGILPRTRQGVPKNNYNSVIGGIFTPAYLPEDAH